VRSVRDARRFGVELLLDQWRRSFIVLDQRQRLVVQRHRRGDFFDDQRRLVLFVVERHRRRDVDDLEQQQLFVDQLFVDQLLVDQLLVDQLLVDQLFVDQLFVDQLFVEQLLVEQQQQQRLRTVCSGDGSPRLVLRSMTMASDRSSIHMKDQRIPPRLKTWTFRIGLSLAVMGASWGAYAGVPVVFTSGQTLTAAELNADFSALTPFLVKYAGASTTTNITTTWTPVPFPTKVLDDTAGAVSTPAGTWTFTAPAAGSYRAHASVWINTSTTSGIAISFFQNGDENTTAQRGTVGASDTVEIAAVIPLAKGDTLTVNLLAGAANSVQGVPARTWVDVEGPIPAL
jgi:hypothetical protein